MHYGSRFILCLISVLIAGQNSAWSAGSASTAQCVETQVETALIWPGLNDSEIRNIFTHAKNHHGITYNPNQGGALRGQSHFAVAIYPELTRVVSAQSFSPAVIKSFIRSNRRHLRDPSNNIGIWRDPNTGDYDLDITTLLPNQNDRDARTAAAIARFFNQKAFFDLKTGTVIPAEGTGDMLPTLPPLKERSELIRKMLR